MKSDYLDKASYIKNKRINMGLSPIEFALLLDMNESGERTVRGWESGEHKPTEAKWIKILNLPDSMPFKNKNENVYNFKFIDLFAGIGGIRLPFQNLNGKCVFSSEWDKFAQKTYAANYGELPSGDITKILAKNIPDHDILLAGFPCQAFSQAGKKQGFQDTRGTMFFEIQRVLVEKRPKMFLLENVKQLQTHNKGRTLQTILSILRGKLTNPTELELELPQETKQALSQKLNYWVDFKVLRAADFGIPQNRERIFIVGFDQDYFGKKCNFNELFSWPSEPKFPTRLGDILEDLSDLKPEDDCYTISNKLWEGHQRRKIEHGNKGNGFGYTLYDHDSPYSNTLSARYYKDGSEILISQNELGKNPRKLTPRECARLQGFPEEFIVNAVSQGQIYKQFGNSVCVKVVEAVAQQIIKCFNQAEIIKNN